MCQLLVDHGHVNASLVDGCDTPTVKRLAGLIDFDPSLLGQ